MQSYFCGRNGAFRPTLWYRYYHRRNIYILYQLERSCNRFGVEIVIILSVLICAILPAFFLSVISTPENSCPKKGASFQVSILSYSDFTIFSHQTQYFDTFFQYPVKRNRTASLEQDILFHTWPAERSVGPSLLFQKHLQYKSPLFEAAAGVEMRQPFYSFHQSLELQFCITDCTEIWFLHLHIACKCLHLGSAVRIIVFLSIFELNFHVSFHFFGFCELSGYFSSRL